jgi:hypothetical protein
LTVSVLVPFRPDGGHRDAAWQLVSGWWAGRHPDWQVVTGRCPDGPWVKALAVADALARADGDVVVVADADLLCDGVGAAVAAVQAGAAWAIPHLRVHRLSETATAGVYAGAGPACAARRGGLASPPYRGRVGGGLAVMARATYGRVPLDFRFAGYGQEDVSWGRALTILAGRPWRGRADLWHLWHSPQARQPGQPRGVGSRASLDLYRRYRAARTPAEMRALVGEFHNGCAIVPV